MRITLEISDELGPAPEYTPGPPGQLLMGVFSAKPPASLDHAETPIEKLAAALVRVARAHGADVEGAE